jgi:cysteinyl-tRNA synthetase
LFDKIARYLELLKNQFTQMNVIDIIDKLIVKINRNYKKIKKDITIICKIITNLSLSIFSPFFIYFKNNS